MGTRRLRTILGTLLGCVVLLSMQAAGLLSIQDAMARGYVPGGPASITRHASGTQTGRFVPTTFAPILTPGAWQPQAPTHTPTLNASSPLSSSHTLATAPSPKGRTPGEQPDLRTASSETTLNANGTWTLQSSSAPIFYQDANGNWQPIDTSVVADTSDAGFAFGNKANDWHLHFAAQASPTTPILHGKWGPADFKVVAQGAASVAPTSSGSTIDYPGLFQNTDLLYRVDPARLEETLMLQSANVPQSYSFTYHVPGATAVVDAQGEVIFTDSKGNILLGIGAIQMFEADATGHMLHDAQGSTNIQVALSGTGPDYTVTLTPDATWLADPARRFPVAIDPTYTGATSSGGDASSSGLTYADTHDESVNPTWSFNTDPAERVGNCSNLPTGATGYGTGVNRSYIKFNAPAVAGARVTSATLSLYQTSAYAAGATVNISEIPNTSWTAAGLTWNNHPSTANVKATFSTSGSYNVWDSTDATKIAYDWWESGATNRGIGVSFANEAGGGPACDFFASDDWGSNYPKLVINYVTDGTLPNTGTLALTGAPGSTYTNGAGTVYTSSATVALSPTFSDPGTLATIWSSNWTTVNGVASLSGQPAAHYTVDSAGSQLTADTSSCGGTSCAAETYFTGAVITDMTKQPTYTATFKQDSTGTWLVGAISNTNVNTRFDLICGGTSCTQMQVSTSSGSFSTISIPSVTLAAGTWYDLQVDFPLSNIGEIYVWPVGAARPTTPSASYSGLSMASPSLNFWQYGDNASNLHHVYLGNVVATEHDTSATVGYGVSQMEFSNTGSFPGSCPAPANGTWCVAAQRQAGWTLSSGDGAKTVQVIYRDNAGNLSGTAATSVNSITLDTTGPTASISAPASGAELRGLVTVSGTASDGTGSGLTNTADSTVGVHLFVDGVDSGVPVSTSGTPALLWDATNATPGPHVLTFKAKDAVGNWGATSSSVTVDVSNGGQMPYETYATRQLPGLGISVSANVASGDALVDETDFDVSGLGPDLALSRTYNDLAPSNKLFGWGWTSDLDESLSPNGDGSVTYDDPTGGVHLFLPSGGGYLTPAGLFLTLVHNGDGTYTLTSTSQEKTSFTSAGKIANIVDRNLNALSFTYSSGVLASMVDASGRTAAITVTSGRVTQIALPGSRTYQYAYDGSGYLTDYTDAMSVVTHYGYDSGHRLNAVILNKTSGATDTQTNVETDLTYDTNNRLVKINDPLGNDAQVAYGSAGSWATTVEQLQNGSTSSSPSCGVGTGNYECTAFALHSDGSGTVASLTDPMGHETDYQYNGNFLVTQVTDIESPAEPNKVAASTYDSSGNQLTQTVDPGTGTHLNLTTTMTYDGSNNLVTSTDPAGTITQYTYDAAATGNLTQVIRGYDAVHPSTHDAQTNVTTTYTYDLYGEALTATDPYGVVTKNTYDGYGDPTQQVQNYVSGGAHDAQTNVTTSATFDVLGQELTATDALGVVSWHAYDLRGSETQTIANYISGGAHDAQTNVTSYASFDALDRQVTATNPRGYVALITYDWDGRATQTVQNYDSAHLTTHDSVTNVTTKTAYDAAGDALQSQDPSCTVSGTTSTDCKITNTTYDQDNRATEVVVENGAGAISQDTQTTYFGDGKTASTTQVALSGSGDPNLTTSSTYDAANRTWQVTAPPATTSGTSNVTTTTYDAAGDTTATTVTNGTTTVSTTTAVFDRLGHQTSKTEEAQASSSGGSGTSTTPQTTSYAFDLGGRQTSVTTPDAKTTTTAYDALGRTTTVTNPDTTTITTSYDADGRTLTSHNASGTTTDTYDPLGRTASEVRTDASSTTLSTVTSTYDADGNALTKTTTLGSGSPVTLTYTFDPLDRQSTLNDNTRTYTYNPSNGIDTMVVNGPSGPAAKATYKYDPSNRVITQTDFSGSTLVQLHRYDYTYDSAGNRDSSTLDTTATTTYTYDGENQLLSAVLPSGVTDSYTYDANNNRKTMTVTTGGVGATTSYTYDAANVLLTRKTDAAGKYTDYTYDTNGTGGATTGNLVKSVYDASGANQITTYGYDSNTNRLMSIVEPSGTTITFTYDADGNRLSKTVVAGSTTTVVNDIYQQGHIAYETDSSGTLLATFTYDSMGVPVSVQVGSNPSTAPRYYYQFDGQGNVVALTDIYGASAGIYAYDEFGMVTTDTETFTNGWHNPYLYDGKDLVRYDAETGLYWMSVRAYDPSIGRFISRDPLGRAPAFFANAPYTYAGNNPLTNVDPTGEFIEGITPAQARQLAISVNARMHAQRGRALDTRTYKFTTVHKNGNFTITTTTSTLTYTDWNNGSTTSTNSVTSQTSCPASCVSEQNDARKTAFADIGFGLLATIGGFGALAFACNFGPSCWAAAKIFGPIGLQGAHWLLDGIDTLHQMDSPNNIGDVLTLTIRTAKLGIDLLQMVLGAANILDVAIQAFQGFKALAKVLWETTVAHPSSDGIIATLFNSGIALRSFTGDFGRDIDDLRATEVAMYGNAYI